MNHQWEQSALCFLSVVHHHTAHPGVLCAVFSCFLRWLSDVDSFYTIDIAMVTCMYGTMQ